MIFSHHPKPKITAKNVIVLRILTDPVNFHTSATVYFKRVLPPSYHRLGRTELHRKTYALDGTRTPDPTIPCLEKRRLTP